MPEFFVKRQARRPRSAARPATGAPLGSLCLLAILCLFLSLPEQATAHGVYIFAWADGPRICTKSYFSKTSRVMGGEILMADSRGTTLDSGRSDDAGMLCFAPPREAQDLAFTVKAGQGHKGEFLLPASEVGRAIAARQREGAEAGSPASLPGGSAAENITRPVSSSGVAASPVPAAPAGSPAGEQALSPAARAEVLAMIRQEISSLRQSLAEQKNDASPGPRDILGGLGWIFGLAALGALYYNRNKRS